jgi:hypothetical protein
MLRRNPVTVPEQSPDIGHRISAPFAHRAEALPEAMPALQAGPLSKAAWPLQIGPTVDWSPGRRLEEVRSEAAHGGSQANQNSNRESTRGFANEASGEARLLEDLETVGQEA